jgi:hypothetical protein
MLSALAPALAAAGLAGGLAGPAATGASPAAVPSAATSQATAAATPSPSAVSPSAAASPSATQSIEATASPSTAQPQSLPAAFTGFSVSLGTDGMLAYSGCLGLPAGIPAIATVRLSRPSIEYAARPEGPWHALATATLASTPCGNDGKEFSGHVGARLNLAYYRARLPGSTGASGAGSLDSTSPALLAWKFDDQITSFTVSPATTSANGRLTVTGALQCFSSGWHAYAGQAVLIIMRPRGQRTWYWIRQVITGPDGHFTVKLPDPLTATWSAEFLGDATHLAAVAAMDKVRVR